MKNHVLWRRRVFIAIVALVVGWGLYQGFRPQPIEVDVGTVERGPLKVTVEQEGRTRVNDRYVVTAPVNGYLRRVALEVGDLVTQGDTLAQLEPVRVDALDARRQAEAEARVASVRAQVEAAEQRLQSASSQSALARKEWERVRALQGSGLVSADSADRASAAVEQGQAEQRAAQAGLDSARHELAQARSALIQAASAGAGGVVPVRAPVSGRVLRVVKKSEGAVSAGQPLLELGDPRALEVEVDVLSADAVRLRPGTPVVLTRWGGEAPLLGEVSRVEPAGFTKVSALGVEEQRVWVIVALRSPPQQWQGLGDGYRVEASFILWQAEEVLQLPASALFRDGDNWAVFVVVNGRAEQRQLRIGQRNGLSAQVVQGLAKGDRVIVHPDDRVAPGVAVKDR